MSTRITPQIGRVYRRNMVMQNESDFWFDMIRGTTAIVTRITDYHAIGTIVEGNQSVKPGSVFTASLRSFTDQFFDAEPVKLSRVRVQHPGALSTRDLTPDKAVRLHYYIGQQGHYVDLRVISPPFDTQSANPRIGVLNIRTGRAEKRSLGSLGVEAYANGMWETSQWVTAIP